MMYKVVSFKIYHFYKMTSSGLTIYVFAHWIGLNGPTFMGHLHVNPNRARRSFRFEYAQQWLKSSIRFYMDPDLEPYLGAQYPQGKELFGIFSDSMPDTWGKTLLKRLEFENSKKENRKPKKLRHEDFLLGVFDNTRMGALRFKNDLNGPFLESNPKLSIPPFSSLPALEHAINQMERDEPSNDFHQWLKLLIAPGSSLGGARPKANVLDSQGNLWMAKFPSKYDTIDKSAWEFLAYQLAIDAGIEMSPSKIRKFGGNHHVFLTKRFDRIKGHRIHFSSSMTLTGNTEEKIQSSPPSYLELVDFIESHCTNVKENLVQLWRRLIFNIAISNTDDHLRNHGFLFKDNQWSLSPCYDVNPNNEKVGLSLNIDLQNNALDFELAKSVGAFFRLSQKEMNAVYDEVLSSVKRWKKTAQKMGISPKEQDLMASAFHC